MTAIHIGNHCLSHAHSSPEALIREAEQALSGVDYDTLVGVGFSGALVLPMLALGLGKHMLLVRKPGDTHRYHDDTGAEGNLGHRWLFVDDGMVTGGTLQHARDEVARLARQAGQVTQFAGAYLYGHDPIPPWPDDPAHFIAPGDHRLEPKRPRFRLPAGAFAV